MFFSRLSKIIALVLMLGLTVGCATKLAPKANEKEQEKVKQEVLQLLEKEYSQPFKIVDYSYSYDTHYPAGNCSGETCTIRKFGTYDFKIQAVDNPIIVMSFIITDDDHVKGFKKFKEHYVKTKYCVSLSQIFLSKKQDTVDRKYLQKAKVYCDSKNQSYYKKWQ